MLQDICSKNLVMALPDAVSHFSNIAADKIYIIDFGSSQQYKLGPGHQPSVRLGPAACRPPLNMDSFDPYSWDMYCTGVLFRMLAGVSGLDVDAATGGNHSLMITYSAVLLRSS